MASTQQQKGSFGSSSNYQRLVAAYGPPPATTPTDGWHQQADGSWLRWNGTAWLPTPDGPPHLRPPVSDVAPFTAEGVFDKVGLLLVLAVAAGVVADLLRPPLAVLWVALFAALGVGLWAAFRPRMARVLAPVYALLEGSVLGVISGYYQSQGRYVVVTAVMGTLAITVGVWALYRSGLIRVGHRFLQVTMVATLGLLVAAVVAIFTGLSFNGMGGFVIFGIAYLFIGVMNLFVDFDYARRAQAAGVDKEGEWYSAFSIMVSMVMVYLALLRILGGGRR